eukprot:scaffold5329_cov85-Skeletonema_menzelii.AAC.2
MRARSRSISPSTSIRSRSCSENSDSDDSDDTSRYAGLTGEELNEIWERRNLAYFDRRQRKLAEERERQQEEDSSGGDGRSSSSSYSVEELGAAGSEESSPSSSQSGQQRQRQRQPLTRPEGFVCAADDPTWQDFVSRNIMGDYDPERARREPAYHNAWVSCERLVNMNRGAAAAGNFIPTNPRFAALLEHRRLEVARERYEEEAARRQQQQQQQQLQGGAVQHDNMMVDGASHENPSFATSAAAEQQAAEYERLNQAHRLQQQQSVAHAHGSNSNNMKSSSTESSTGKKSARKAEGNSYYMGLPYKTQHLVKPVRCGRCNIALYTSAFAKRFFCQLCGCVSCVPSQCADASLEEKMQDAEDQDCEMSY